MQQVKCNECDDNGYVLIPQYYDDGSLSRTVTQLDCICKQPPQKNTTSEPKYTRDELVEIAEHRLYEDSITVISGWPKPPAVSCVDALIEAGALQVKE